MGGLAFAAKNGGFEVSGLDETAGPPMSTWLDDHDLSWSKTFDPVQLDGVDTVVVSGHHGNDDHSVIRLARQKNIAIVSFAELLGTITKDSHVIAVAGTHGKTTTTSLITWLLEAAGRAPDFLVGIRPFNFEASSRLNGSKLFVVEADEYKASTQDARPKFDYYHPDVLVLTSVEHDHPDIFPTMESYLSAFKNLAKSLPKNGRLVAWAENDNVAAIAAEAACQVVTYGLEKGDYRATDINYSPQGISFEVAGQERLDRVTVPLFGKHNVLNALAATVVLLNEGLTIAQIKAGALTFKGAHRRFALLTPANADITVIDDYAHHPTEAKATIEAAKLHFAGRRLIALYRPHTYSRTQTLLSEYHAAFSDADKLYITDVEPAREAANQRTVSGQEIIDGLPDPVRQNAAFVADREQLIKDITATAKPGDVVLCMTVSGFNDIAGELAKKLS